VVGGLHHRPPRSGRSWPIINHLAAEFRLARRPPAPAAQAVCSRTGRVYRALYRRRGHEDLDLHGKNLTLVPPAVRELTHLRRLHLYNNELTELPGWLGELTRLELLDAARNRITTVPEDLWASGIDVIRLHGNPLDVRAYVDAYVERFNAAVRADDFGPFVATLAPGAVLRFEGTPIGPFEGRDAILAAYREQPPTDTMRVLSAEGDVYRGLQVRFAWHRGGSGTMRLGTQEAGRVDRIAVAFGSA
jgi:steroid delta-isomerase